jgi:hypothetical protein
VLQGGAGCGKTFLEALLVLQFAHQFPGMPGALYSNDMPLLKRTWVPHFERMAREAGILQHLRWNHTENRILWPNGSSCHLLGVFDASTTAATSARSTIGIDLAWAVADEVGLWPEAPWNYLQSRLRRRDYPCWIRAGYTPKGLGHWTAEKLQPREGLDVVRMSAFGNPSLGKAYFERIRREWGEDSPMWRQEVLGEFVAFEGLIYPQFDLAAHARPCERIPGAPLFQGIDWGATEGHPTVALVAQWNGEANQLEVLAERRYLNMSASQTGKAHLAWLQAAGYDKPSLPITYSTAHEKTERIEWQDLGFPMRVTPRPDILSGLYAVEHMMVRRPGRDGELGTPMLVLDPEGCAQAIQEVRFYRWDPKKDRVPLKAADDGPDALRYLCCGLWYAYLKHA